MTYIDPALLESIGIYGDQQQNFANTVPGGIVGTPPSVAPGTPYTTATSGAAIITAFLRNYGIDMTPELADYANNLRSVYGADTGGLKEQLANDVYDPTNKLGAAMNAKFPEVKARRDKGLTPISFNDAVDYRDTVTKVMRNYGLPPDFYDSPDDFVKFHTNDLSAVEIQNRIAKGYGAAMAADQEVRNQLSTLYGVDLGQLAAYYLDPVRGEALLSKQLGAAQAGAGAKLGGYALNQAEAERVAAAGITEADAATAFGSLTNAAQLMAPLPGEAGGPISREAQIGSVVGVQSAQAELDRKARARRAVFGAGGGFAGATTGLTGLGQANT